MTKSAKCATPKCQNLVDLDVQEFCDKHGGVIGVSATSKTEKIIDIEVEPTAAAEPDAPAPAQTVVEPAGDKKESPEKKPTQDLMAIAIDERGLVKAKTNSELIRYCNALIGSEMVPDRFNTPQKLFGALMFARSVGLPDTAIRQVAVIHGVPSLFGDLPLALIQKSGDLNKFKEQWFDKEYKIICFENKNLEAEVFGAVCFAARGRDEEAQSFSFTLDDARTAGLYPASKPSMPWTKYTKIMLRYKARAIMAKSLFADKTSGIGIGEYDFDEVIENVKDVTPKEQSNNLKNTFEGESSN